MQDQKGNARRYKGISGTKEPIVCSNCGKTFYAIPNRKYCSEECRKIANIKIKKENSKEFYEERRKRAMQ